MTTANLVIKNAVITKFKTGKTSGTFGPINTDNIMFAYESRNAEVNYSSNVNEVFMRAVAGFVGAVMDSVGL